MNNIDVTKEKVLAQFDSWNLALQSGDPKKVTALYSEDAILLPTLSNDVCHNHLEREAYFVNFLARGPKGRIDEFNIRTHGELAINSGIYTFSFKDGTTARARFTFVYMEKNDHWVIVEHHSSLLPE